MDASPVVQRFLLLTPPATASPGSSYWTELQYLKSKGVPEDSFQLARWRPKPARRPGVANRLFWNTWLATRHQQQLKQAVGQDLSFLFVDHGAQIVSDEGVPFPPKFDYAFLTLAIDRLRIRVAHGRGDLSVSIASQQGPLDFYELTSLLMLSGSPQEGVSRRSYMTLPRQLGC